MYDAKKKKNSNEVGVCRDKKFMDSTFVFHHLNLIPGQFERSI